MPIVFCFSFYFAVVFIFNVFLFPPSKAQLTGDFAPYAKRSEMFVALFPFGIILFSCNTEGVGDVEGDIDGERREDRDMLRELR